MADVPDALTVVETVAGALRRREDELRLGGGEAGPDELPEEGLRRLLAEALASKFGVWVRPPLPSSHLPAFARHGRPADMVLSPAGCDVWPPGGPDLFTPPTAVPPEQALWLMMRVSWRWPPPGVVQTPLPAELKRFRRLASDPHVHHAAVLAVAFLSDADELPHVLVSLDGMLQGQCDLWHYEPELRHVRTLSLTDRRGHRATAVGLWPVRLWRALLRGSAV